MIIDVLQTSLSAVLAWLLTYAIHSTLLLGAAALVAWRFADEHRWLGRMWKTAMLGAIVTTSLQVGVEHEPLAGRWAVIPAEAGHTTRGTSYRLAPVPRTPHANESAATRDESAAVVSSQRAAVPADFRGAPTSDERDLWPDVRRHWPSALVAIWCGIAAIGLTRFALAHRRVRRALFAGAHEDAVPFEESAMAWRQSARARLVVSTTCDVPVALPGRAIVLPDRFTTELQRDEQHVALAHEIAHVVRRDPEWLSLAVALERLFFFQPLNRLARRELSASAEFLCDEWAVERTGTPLALARSLVSVAAWASPAVNAPAGAVAMARGDSPLVRRVERILSGPSMSHHPSSIWFAAALVVVGAAAPMFSAELPLLTAIVPAAERTAPVQQPASQAQIAKAREQLRLVRPPSPADSLPQRWTWALAEARRRGLSDFWIAYSFETPTHADQLMITDSEGTSFVTDQGTTTLHGSMIIADEGKRSWQGPPLVDLLDDVAPAGGRGTIVVTLRYSSARENAITRGSYRSARLGCDFRGRPVFWLGSATESDSFRKIEQLTSEVRNEKLRTLFIEAASVHPTTDLVLPFLARMLDPSNPVAIRREAAEGFDHHHDPRSVEILVRTARQDPSEEVRAEAAETIGEVQTPESIPALKDLALNSSDSAVRREAAEAFSDQPADRALPALESVIAASTDEGTLAEAVEALGEFSDPRAAHVLLDVVWKHPNEHARREAVETLGELEGDAARAALVRIIWEHPEVSVQREAVETLGDKANADALTELERIVREHPAEEVQAEAIETIADASGNRLHPIILQAARSAKNPAIRREAIDSLSDAAGETSDTSSLDQVERILEASIFEDADHSVRSEALDALDRLPAERARRVLRKVIDRHPDERMREEAKELERDRNR